MNASYRGDPRLTVPLEWREMLPRQEFVTVLPFHDAAGFCTLLSEAEFRPRRGSDAGDDVLSVYRHGLRPIWLTGYRDPDKEIVSGRLDFGGHRGQPHNPNIAFSVLYGSPDTVTFDWIWLFETLESQFEIAGRDHRVHRQIMQRWRPHLRPLAEMMDSLETTARTVVLMGERRHQYTLQELGIRHMPGASLINPVSMSAVRAVGNVIEPDGRLYPRGG